MPSYSVAEAKNTLPRLIDRAMAGEEVVITRHGKIVVEVKAKKPIDLAARKAIHDRIAAHTMAMPMSAVSSLDVIKAMYDEEPRR